MRLSNNGYQLIRNFEGVRNNAYLDVKSIPTIGIGFIKLSTGPVKLGMYLTDKEIQEEFFKQITMYEDCVNRSVTHSNLTQNMFDSLVSFTFNCGCNALKNSTLLKLINTNHKDAKITEAFLKWCKAGKVVVKGLLNRRIAEAKLYFS